MLTQHCTELFPTIILWGFTKKAETYLNKLKSQYPSSPYIKSANRNIPDEEESIESEEIVKTTPKKVEDKKEEFKYTIQAGAFLNFANADKLKDNFVKAGYFSEVKPKSVGGTILNVVTIGKFINENEAKPILEFLLRDYKLSGRVISLSN